MALNNDRAEVKYTTSTLVSKYVIPFQYWKTSEITVQLVDVDNTLSTLTNNVDYSISNCINAQGTLTRISSWGTNKTLIITRNISLTQETVYYNGQEINAKVIERDFDKTVARVIQVNEQLKRVLKVSISEENDNLILPLSDLRKDSLLGFDETGKNLVMTKGADVQKLLNIIEENRVLMVKLRDETAELAKNIKTEYVEIVGNGEDNVYIIDHNLNTTSIDVVVWSNSEPFLLQKNCEIEIINENTIYLTFPEVIINDSMKVVITTTATATALGLNSYIHIAWSSSSDGVEDFSLTNTNNYLGIYVDHLIDASINPSRYSWILMKGEKGDKGAIGDTGESPITVQIQSSNGNLFKVGKANTTLTAYVFRGTENITDEIDSENFRWVRISEDTDLSDAIWNTSSKAIGKKSVIITEDDAIGRTVFNCEVEI